MTTTPTRGEGVRTETPSQGRLTPTRALSSLAPRSVFLPRMGFFDKETNERERAMTSITVSVDGLSPTDLVGYARMFAELADDPKRSPGHRAFLAELGARLRETYDSARAAEDVTIDWLEEGYDDIIGDVMRFGDDLDFRQPTPELPPAPDDYEPPKLGWVDLKPEESSSPEPQKPQVDEPSDAEPEEDSSPEPEPDADDTDGEQD
jgi:hypothetical protein